MQTTISKRNKYQMDVVMDVMPEVTVDTDAMSISFPYGPGESIEKLREASKSLKGSGPVKAVGAIQKVLADSDSPLVVVLSDEGEVTANEGEATTKPKRTKKPLKTTSDGLCLCGCGEEVTREFKPGHDARYKGQMIRLVLASEAEPANERIAQSGGYALAVIQGRNWTSFLDKSRDAVKAKAAKKAANPNSTKKGKVAADSHVKISEMKEASALLKRVGRYGEKSGERYIPVTPDTIPSILDGTHPDFTDADKVELGFATADPS